jgi:hypothetical protein
MLKRALVVLFAFAFVSLAPAQSMNVAQSPKQPDKQLSYTVTLDAPIKGDVTQIYLSFSLVTAVRPDQQGLEQNFDIMSFDKLSDVQYRVYGERPRAMSGTYQLKGIQFRTSGGIRNYAYSTDFKQEIKLDIDTHETDIFPDIKSVEKSH